MSGNARWPAWLGLALFVAGLANGIGPYLRRTGLIETARYEAFWDLHTGPGGFTTAPLGIGRRCVTHRRIEDGGAEMAGGGPPARYVHAVRGWEVPGKALKDAVVVALAAGGLVALARGGNPRGPLARAWPLAALAALVAWQAAAGLARGEPLMAAAGLRAFAFLGVALTAAWARRDVVERLVPWLVALLAVQALLSPLELLRGIPVQGHGYLWGEYFARRAAGTFVMPNTLGVFAACVVALAAGFGATARLRAAAWGLGGCVVVVSGSATGLVLLVAVGVFQGLFGERRPGLLATAALSLAAVAAGWFLFLGRADVLHSLAARGAALRASLDAPAAELLLGRGIGLGTNASWQLLGGAGNEAARAALARGGDSAAVALVLQTGLAGLALFLAALALAFVRCAPARPLVLALALASLTLNVPEAFPLNVLLAIALGGPCSGAPSASSALRARGT